MNSLVQHLSFSWWRSDRLAWSLEQPTRHCSKTWNRSLAHFSWEAEVAMARQFEAVESCVLQQVFWAAQFAQHSHASPSFVVCCASLRWELDGDWDDVCHHGFSLPSSDCSVKFNNYSKQCRSKEIDALKMRCSTVRCTTAAVSLQSTCKPTNDSLLPSSNDVAMQLATLHTVADRRLDLLIKA
jgi:hypothetical protein